MTTNTTTLIIKKNKLIYGEWKCNHGTNIGSDSLDINMPGKYWQLRTNKVKRVWRYLRDNQNPSIEVGQIIQWPKEKGQTTIRKILHRKLKIEQHEPH